MKRSKFSLSHYRLLTCKMGQLVPVTWFEALPGDTIQQATSALIRCAPLVTPVMHPVQVRFHHWFVPNRLIWTNWQDYITGGADGNNASAHPFIDYANTAPNQSDLGDYLGVPAGAGVQVGKVNALPFRAYALIYNEFYRDEDLVTKLPLVLTDGQDSNTYGANASSVACANIAWEKDYFTTTRPWVLKGPSVTLPLGTTAPVGDYTGGSHPLKVSNIGSPITLDWSGSAGTLNNPLLANLSGATAVDINTVRHAFAIQRFEEARARYGSRYTEYLRYLGVRSSDARLQRPEYLGGGRNTIQFSEVLQTGGTSAGGQTGVGNLAGHGISAMRTNRYRRFFEEHGIVMTLMSVRPKTMYSQPLFRKMMRGIAYSGLNGSKEDYWQRELQHIGQQGVNAREVDWHNTDTTFGYQDRYDEYRRVESSVHGLFKGTLDTWHLSREFSGVSALNSTFINCVPATRTFADTTSDNLYVMANHSIQARRLVAREGTSMSF